MLRRPHHGVKFVVRRLFYRGKQKLLLKPYGPHDAHEKTPIGLFPASSLVRSGHDKLVSGFKLLQNIENLLSDFDEFQAELYALGGRKILAPSQGREYSMVHALAKLSGHISQSRKINLRVDIKIVLVWDGSNFGSGKHHWVKSLNENELYPLVSSLVSQVPL